jgi:hypothetical protein
MRLRLSEWFYTNLFVLWPAPVLGLVCWVSFTFGDWTDKGNDHNPQTHVSIAVIGLVLMIVGGISGIFSIIEGLDRYTRKERRRRALQSRAIRYRRRAHVVIPQGNSVTVKLYDARANGAPRQYFWPLALRSGDRDFGPIRERTFYLDQDGQDEAAHQFVAEFKASADQGLAVSPEAAALARALTK